MAMAALILLLKYLKYRYFVRDLSIEFYGGMIAVIFVALGVWMGTRLTRNRREVVATASPLPQVQSPSREFPDEESVRLTGISRRELEVLTLMSLGNSNAEIADKMFVSINTVKTHAASVYVKLDARRRTQAIQKAKELGLIP